MEEGPLKHCAQNYKLWIISIKDDSKSEITDYITKQDYLEYVATVKDVLTYMCKNGEKRAESMDFNGRLNKSKS